MRKLSEEELKIIKELKYIENLKITSEQQLNELQENLPNSLLLFTTGDEV